ncbi:MAG TPA: glycosyltransferase family 39 protein [Cyclobacteriaceae bacterium]|nr:glycosyltransferase family 39 protein [Cyclobacteriaceae bacterium]
MVRSSIRNPVEKREPKLRALKIVLALAIIVYGWNFWGTSIYMLDEARNAGSAAEMIRRGDYAVPTFNNEFHDKPALQYFFMIAGYKMFGVGPFGARVFSVVMGILTVLSIFLFTSKVFDEKSALFASLVYIASLQMAVQFRLAVPDPYLLFCLTTAWFCFYLGYSKNNTRFLYAFYVLTGLGFLAKGPIAFALTGISILLFLVWRRDFSFKRLMELKLVPGAAISLAVGLPWYVASGIATNWEWPKYFFFTHNLDRYVNTFEGHGGFPFDVVLIAFAALLPASVLMPQAITTAIKKRNESFYPFALSICIAVLGFFFFSKTLLPSYPAPCIAFLAILLGNYTAAGRPSVISGVFALIICLAIPAAAYIALEQDPLLSTLTDRWVIFLIAPVGAAIALYYIIKGNMNYAVYAWTGSFMVLLLMVFTFLLPQVDARNPVALSKGIIDKSYSLAYYKRINSAFVFQNHKPIPKLETPEQLQLFSEQHEKVMIISTRQDWEETNVQGFKVVFRSKDLFESPESIIVVKE